MKPFHVFFLICSFVFNEKSYFRYRWTIFITGVINFVVNFGFERIVIRWLENVFDRRFKNKRALELKEETESH